MNCKEQNLCEFDVLAQAISMSDNVTDEQLQKCYDILEDLLQKPTIKVSELTLLASFRYALYSFKLKKHKIYCYLSAPNFII